MTMEELLETLEKQAGIEKQSSDSKDTTKDKPALSAELEGLLTKTASDTTDAKKAGEELAKTLLEKVAQEKKAETKEVPEVKTEPKTEEEDMNKQAEEFANQRVWIP